MKKILFIITSLFCIVNGSAQDKKYLVLQLADKTSLAFELNDQSTEYVEFEESNIQINWDLKIDYSNLCKIYVSDKLPLYIGTVKKDQDIKYSVKRGMLYLTTLPKSNVTIFSISGVVIYMNTSVSGSESIDISNLSAGIYILKVNNKTVKFQKI